MAARDAPRPTGTSDHLRREVESEGVELVDQLNRFGAAHGCADLMRQLCAEVPSVRRVVATEARRRAERRADLLAAELARKVSIDDAFEVVVIRKGVADD